MNLLDYIIIILMIYLIVRGLLRGFVREIASLAGIVLGIWIGNLFQPQMTVFLRSYLPFPRYVPLISFAVIFAAVLVACNIIGWFLKTVFRKIFLGWVDRGLGAVFAILKGVVIIYLVIVMLTFFIPAKTPLISRSMLAPWIIRSYQSMIGLISPDQYREWKKRIQGEGKKLGGIIAGTGGETAGDGD
jgi:membrane protein required for colicin V production